MISSPSCRSRSRPGKTAAICHSPIPCYPRRTKRRKRMTEMPTPSEDRYAHLRAYAARQKQTTLDRLEQAIAQLEREGRPVTTFTIREASGLDYMAYYRNPEALALFRRHSTHLRKEREIKRSRRKSTRNR